MKGGVVAKHSWKIISGEQESPPVITSMEIGLFDREDIYPDCTVQVLTNTITGETSVGWWENTREDDETCL